MGNNVLNGYLEAAAHETFAYGKWDCAVFVERYYGLNILSEFKYDKSSADRMLIKHYKSTLTRHGFKKTDDYKVGDVVMFKNGSIGLCVNEKWGATVTERGIVILTMNKAKEVWTRSVNTPETVN